MNVITHFKKGLRIAWSLYNLPLKSLVFGALMLTGIQASLQAQGAQFTKPSWWFGAAGAANINFYSGSTQRLNADFTAPVPFHNGTGAGHYVAALAEYHPPESVLGVSLQVGYDSRKGLFDQEVTPSNSTADLSAILTYVTVEPTLRVAPFKSGFYLYGGPRLAFNSIKSFNYKQTGNPDTPGKEDDVEINDNFDNINKTLISMQIGAGYDIPVSSQNRRMQMAISPFVSYHPYFGQSPRSVETWNISTLRIGATFKFGRGSLISIPAPARVEVVVTDPEVAFSVNSPRNIPVERRMRETFPLRNYVFFNIGSTEIPDRYVLLRIDQVKDFKEDQLEVFAPKKLSGRSGREMIVYYNVLNILGDRLGKNPSTTITLVGSSEKGPADGREMAESVKRYLTGIFGINDSRISIEGCDKPKIPSGQPGGTRELDLLREGDRRVSIESNSPALLMEFQSGPDAPLKPVEIIAVQEAPLDSYVTFKVDGGQEAFSSWSLEIRDEQGKLYPFGPFTQDKVSMPGKFILGDRPEGDYQVTMVGQTKSGRTVRKETSVHMVLWTPPQNEEGMRFSVIFEFNESKAIRIYEKYLTEIVTPKIPKGGTVIIHGHTDIIGEETHNQQLSLDRAYEVKSIIENSLSKAGRSDVKFEVYGFGEDENLSPFENKYPEERFYNRTVVIDIIRGK